MLKATWTMKKNMLFLKSPQKLTGGAIERI
jgi:hypothetical protein